MTTDISRREKRSFSNEFKKQIVMLYQNGNEMSLTMFMYLISVLDAVNEVTNVFFVLNFVVIGLSLAFGPLVANDLDLDVGDILTKTRKYFKYYLMTLCTFLFLFIVIPSNSTMYGMLAINIGENVYQLTVL